MRSSHNFDSHCCMVENCVFLSLWVVTLRNSVNTPHCTDGCTNTPVSQSSARASVSFLSVMQHKNQRGLTWFSLPAMLQTSSYQINPSWSRSRESSVILCWGCCFSHGSQRQQWKPLLSKIPVVQVHLLPVNQQGLTSPNMFIKMTLKAAMKQRCCWVFVQATSYSN